MKFTQSKEMQNCNYRFEINDKEKTLKCIVGGKFSYKQAIAYIEEFKRLISTIEDIEKYTLIVDARKQEVYSEEVIPLIKKVTSLYMETPFKSMRCVRLENEFAHAQVVCYSDKRFSNVYITEDTSEKYIDDVMIDIFIDIEKELLKDRQYIEKFNTLYKLLNDINNAKLQTGIESTMNDMSRQFRRRLYKVAFVNGAKSTS